MNRDETYSWGELLACIRAYWAVRHHGAGDSMSSVRMLDVSRAYSQLSDDDRRAVFLGIWLEREPIPALIVANMRRYLNGDT